MNNLYRYKIPLKAPLHGMREGFLLELHGGWGEIAPLPGFSRETLEECEAELRRIWPQIETADSKLPAVRWGLECARKPWPPHPFRKPLSALLWEGPVPKGYRAAKLKLKNLPIHEAIRKIREILGPYELRLDCNRAWNLSQALEFASHFTKDDFAYLEEPLQSMDELKEFSRLTRFPLAADETVGSSPWERISTLKTAIVKPMILGQIPKLPEEIDLVVSGVYETGIGTLHNSQIATKRALGLDTYRYLMRDVLKTPLRIEEGHLVWDGPFEIDQTALRQVTFNV
ncbi:MAG: hypothetical protein JSS32_04505 [Verrucomicrobia bacterium]|nr:hypothetical protein [Verrucomicrobiota bacterium]